MVFARIQVKVGPPCFYDDYVLSNYPSSPPSQSRCLLLPGTVYNMIPNKGTVLVTGLVAAKSMSNKMYQTVEITKSMY